MRYTNRHFTYLLTYLLTYLHSPDAGTGKSESWKHLCRRYMRSTECQSRLNRHLTHSRLQVTGCTAEILLTPRCSPRARDFPGLLDFSVRRTVAELRGVKLAQFSDFGFCRRYIRSIEFPSSLQL